MRKQATIERFWSKVIIRDNGCWEWTGSLSSNGYGMIWHNDHIVRAHRFVYEYITHSVIPDAKEVDHLCRNHQCVNPRHLEVVTHRENVMRGINPTLLKERMLAITHCPRGHEYSKENTYINPKGYRFCRACKVISDHQYYSNRRALEGEE